MSDFVSMFGKLKSKKILITGATGFVGKNLCEYLLKLNKEHQLEMNIGAMARNPSLMEGVSFYSHDLKNPILLEERFDLIIHAATPVTNPKEGQDEIYDIIVNGTKHILDFAKKSSTTHLLVISSGAVYGDIPEGLENIPENFMPTTPLTSAYARGKAKSEELVFEFLKNNNLIINIARCFAFSGKHLPLNAHYALGNFVRDMLSLEKKIHVLGDGSAVRSYMDASDLVFWLLAILLNDRSDIFNVGSDLGISIKDLAYEVAGLASPPGAVVIQGKRSENLKVNRYVPSIAKAKEVLNLEMKMTRELSIKKMLEWNRGRI